MNYSAIMSLAIVVALGATTACDNDEFQESETAAVDEALTQEIAAASVALEAEEGCYLVGGIVDTLAVNHLHDEALTQSSGPLRFASLVAKNPLPGLRRARGTAVLTVVGKNDDGVLLGNHHFLFSQGTVRTSEDLLFLEPTEEPCLLRARSQLFVHDGTGVFEGVTGEGTASGTLDVCTGEGRIVWKANYCF